jgi:hypothetical protein
VRVTVQLKKPVAYQVRQRDGELVMEFGAQ